MAPKPEPTSIPTETISEKFQKLSKTAASLNAESDKLTNIVQRLDAALRKLNLGVSSWVKFEEWEDEAKRRGRSEIGYDKSNFGAWSIYLRVIPDGANPLMAANTTTWLFNGAPRELRIRAISHVAKLIEALNAAAQNVTEKLAEGNKEAEELTVALGMATDIDATAEPSKQSQTEVK